MKIKIGKEIHEFVKGATIHDMAKQLLGNAEKNIVCGKIENELVDMFIPIKSDCELEFVFLSSVDGKKVLRHTAAHILAHAVQTIYPTARLTIGPPIDDGFFYDIDFKSPVSIEDLPKIEEEMKKIVKANFRIERKEISRSEAIALAKSNDEPFKLELIKDFDKSKSISIYSQGEWYDICRGPHLRSTGMVKFFKLTRLSGAYFKGDQNNKMLTRIYGVAFETKKEMEDYFQMLEEAEKRDNRKLGSALDLFFFHETSPGSPYWLPKGWKLYNILLDFWRQVHDENDYLEVSMPVINNVQLWKTSGHLEHYKENMFLINSDGEESSAVKPMSCPNAMIVFKNKIRSYRDLPMRISDCDLIHRYERSGTMQGLKRVRSFRQDDSHNFVTFDQIESEFEHLFDLADVFYSVLGIKYFPRFSTRPESFMGEKSVWDKAESILRSILIRRFGKDGFETDEGGGAFYGPKIDLDIKDALGRAWQTGTFQLDMQLPGRFDLAFTDKDGSRKTPIVIHRAIYGSLERFIGILIEHFAGAFPLWLAPLQVGIVPVSEEYVGFAEKIAKQLKELGIRVELDKNDSSLGAKIKNYSLLKVPYVLVAGKNELENNTLSVRFRNGKQVQNVPLNAFFKTVKRANDSKELIVPETFED